MTAQEVDRRINLLILMLDTLLEPKREKPTVLAYRAIQGGARTFEEILHASGIRKQAKNDGHAEEILSESLARLYGKDRIKYRKGQWVAI